MDLRTISRGSTPNFNASCDPNLGKFYDRVLSSIRAVQRATLRLVSLHSVIVLLECDSYLRRFYTYVTGL